MNGTALYRALVEAGASEQIAKEAVEGVAYAHEAATRHDLAQVKNELEARIEAVKNELEVRMERGFRKVAISMVGLFVASQASTFTMLKLLL